MSFNNWDEEEEVVVLGTAFEPLEVDQTVGKKPDLDLTVRDSEGRRRFHGAFTGGFSAGHYMTVGSEQGFTPRQYVSNREQKWDKTLVQRKPEDFMDSEDLGVFGIAPQRITTKKEFSQQEFAGFRKTDSLIDVLKSVIQPTIESIGLKLYKRMKINARNDSKYSEPKVYSCEQPLNTSANNDLLYKPKSDFHGIGFKAITDGKDSNESKASNGVSAVFKSGRKIQISGEAFGYGVLDEDNEEEAVVYHKDDLSQYDFEIGSLKAQQKNSIKDKHKAIELLKSDVIEGFVKSLTKINLMEIISRKYPTPVVPKHWRQSAVNSKEKKSRWDQSSSKDKSTSNSVETVNKIATKPPVLNANIRAIFLGEEVIHRQGIKKSDFEQKSHNTLDSIKISSNEITDKEIVVQKKNEPNFQKQLTGFWANKFTRSSGGVEENTLSGGLTEFKATQTVSNEKVEKENKNNRQTERTTYEWHPHSLVCKRFNIPNPYPQFPDFVGVVTVGKSDIRNKTSIISGKKVKQNIFDCLLDRQVLTKELESNDTNSETNAVVESDLKSIENIIVNENKDEEEKEETSRPPIDLFKAIFASDEEESDDDLEVDKNDNSESVSINISEKTLNDTKKSELSATKTSGIFANIDFDVLNRDFTPILKTNETQNSVTIESENNKTIEQSSKETKQCEPNDDFYGPALPPNTSLLSLNSIDSDLNSSQSHSKSSKRKKKEKKHKKSKKHKTSHKKSKRHDRRDSTTSSSDVDSRILDHLKNKRK